MSNTHSLDFERSSSQYASITDAAQTGLDLSTDFTFEAWIKLEALPSSVSGFYAIISKDDGGVSPNRSYILYIDNTDKLTVGFFNGGNTSLFQCDTAFASAGVWYHVAVSVDISVPSAEFYIDAVAKTDTTSASTATTIENSDEVVSIGSRNNTDLHFDGLIDDLRVWSDIRTSGEISANYQSELVGNEANLVAYWKLNNNYLDETSNNNDLTATGSPVFSTDVPFADSTSSSVGYYFMSY